VVLVGVSADRPADLARLQAYFDRREIATETLSLPKSGEVSAALFRAADELSAGLMVTGAFGQGRLREFVLGGVTRDVLNSNRPSLFLAH
jgi:nucleotide-binding universal stress UspA family protein